MDVSETIGRISDESRFDSWDGREIFPVSKASGLALGPTQLPIQWILGLLSLKWPECEADHSPLSNAEVKNKWSCAPLPHIPTSQMSMSNSSPARWQAEIVKNWKWSESKVEDDKSCFTFLKYNDGSDSTFHKALLSQTFKDILHDEQCRYKHLLRTWGITS